MGMASHCNYKGSFHYVSKDAFYWIKNQAYVKEESITDRILYELNSNNSHVICHEFKRNEEALNGADWEWWLLFDDPLETHDHLKLMIFIKIHRVCLILLHIDSGYRQRNY